MLDRSFLRPIAHRGLHSASAGRIENSPSAFAAAIAAGHGIECDLRHAADGTAFVFHDATLERLTGLTGPMAAQPAEVLRRAAYSNAERIATFRDLLDLVGGRVPLLVEIKSEWQPLPRAFLVGIADCARSYAGPIALMSFDPAVITEMAELAPSVPRGIVSGRYTREHPRSWWSDRLSAERQERLTHLLESGPAKPHFFAYHVAAMPTPVTRYVREAQGLPLFAWTVRTAQDRAIASAWADAPIFEQAEP